MNPFKPQKGPIDKLKRNTRDLSYSNNITCNFGTLYPVFCKKVSPGDSFSIESTFGLRAQPMIFPVQNQIRADIHFFYVRNRTLWSNFMDFYGKTKEGLEHPYIDRPISDFKTKSIYDYLGVPTTIMTNNYYYDEYAINPMNLWNTRFGDGKSTADLATATAVGEYTGDPLVNSINKIQRITSVESKCIFLKHNNKATPYTASQSLLTNISSSRSYYNGSVYSRPSWLSSFHSFSDVDPNTLYNNAVQKIFTFPSFKFNELNDVSTSIPFTVQVFYAKSSQNHLSIHNREIYFSGKYSSGTLDLPVTVNGLKVAQYVINNQDGVFYSVTGSDTLESFIERGFDLILFLFSFGPSTGESGEEQTSYVGQLATGIANIGPSYSYDHFISDTILDSSERNYLPWCGDNKKLKINALPYRAYEAIYNSFYRNSQVNPFKLTANGQPEYNRYVTNLGDGADSTPYKLYQRNYEYDFLTGAYHSPQQGLAPLVGLTVSNASQTATFKFSSPSINNGAEITATTRINESGEVIGITGYDPDLPQSNIDRLMHSINYGISINDIRQTNALQKWLEKNIRRGYRYKDQLMSHFGVNVEYNELLMPEFIGGVSQDINVDTIYQTATNDAGVLGDYAGRAGVVGGSKHRVSKYCDEAGFIMGILSIVPTPVYSQVPAGYCFDNNLFDYYFPEFGHIGMQPIMYKDILPLQTPNNQLENVFGYQRPYWDLIRSIDEVHGEFRTTANGYIIQRMFLESPMLNQNFIEINSNALNDVFMITDTNVSDQFKGVIRFKVAKKTTIPLDAIPTIE